MEGLVVVLTLLGVPALVVLTPVAFFFARTLARTLALLALGAVGVAVGYVSMRAAGWFDGYEGPDCYAPCGLGDFVAAMLLIGNGTGWALGVVAGALLGRRARRDPRRSARLESAAS